MEEDVKRDFRVSLRPGREASSCWSRVQVDGNLDYVEEMLHEAFVKIHHR